MNTIITVGIVTTISLLNTVFGFKMASYNTFLIPSNKRATSTSSKIIAELVQSDIDLICLQEIVVPSVALQLQAAVKSNYPYSYSEANTLTNLQTPRIPCSADQQKLLESACITQNCPAALFEQNPSSFVGCAAVNCPNDYFPLVDTECQSCLIAQSQFAASSNKQSLKDAVAVCVKEIPFSAAFTGDSMVLSKYPIINQWLYPFHSMVIHQNILITEIDVSQLTNPQIGMMDTIIFGCTHLVATDGEGAYFPTSHMEQELGIKSRAELNAWQTHYILQYVLQSIGETRDSADKDVMGLFIAGDFNHGTALFAENFKLWKDAHFIPAQDLVDDFRGCTSCGDSKGDRDDLVNALAVEECVECKVKNSDLDHILVYGPGEENIDPISHKRIFTNIYDIDGEQLPLSDHWGVLFEAHLINEKVHY